MADLTAKRTLVKSPPELWSELSEVDRLARHLDAFGEIKITKLEPEHTVAWEGERASGTVSIEPSGWGTRVTLTAQLEESAEAEPVAEEAAPVVEEPAVEEPVVEEPAVEEPAVEEPAVEERPEPVLPDEPESAVPRRRRGFLAWLFRERTSTQEVSAAPAPSAPEPVVAAEPEPEPEPDPEPVPEPVVETAPVAEAEVPDPSPPAGDEAQLDPQHAQAVLDEVLEALGAAHHRPFSRG